MELEQALSQINVIVNEVAATKHQEGFEAGKASVVIPEPVPVVPSEPVTPIDPAAGLTQADIDLAVSKAIAAVTAENEALKLEKAAVEASIEPKAKEAVEMYKANLKQAIMDQQSQESQGEANVLALLEPTV